MPENYDKDSEKEKEKEKDKTMHRRYMRVDLFYSCVAATTVRSGTDRCGVILTGTPSIGSVKV